MTNYPNPRHGDDCDCFDCDLKQDRSINERKAAEYLGLSPYTLQKWRWLGRPPSFEKVGRAVRYRARKLQAFRDGLRKRSTSDVGMGEAHSLTAAVARHLTPPGMAYRLADHAALSGQPDDLQTAGQNKGGYHD